MSYEMDGPYARGLEFQEPVAKIWNGHQNLRPTEEILDHSKNLSRVEDYLLVGYGGGMGRIIAEDSC